MSEADNYEGELLRPEGIGSREGYTRSIVLHSTPEDWLQEHLRLRHGKEPLAGAIKRMSIINIPF